MPIRASPAAFFPPGPVRHWRREDAGRSQGHTGRSMKQKRQIAETMRTPGARCVRRVAALTASGRMQPGHSREVQRRITW